MKNLKKYSLLLALIALVACSNKDWEYDDYDYTSCYFPYQTPVRTLLLGKYDQGFNDNDNNHTFQIGATMAGVYTNDEERTVYYQVDPSLLNGVDNVAALPSHYYEILDPSPVKINVGSTKAIINVKLTDAFFTDSLSFNTNANEVSYVIPLKLTEVDGLDSILSGVAADNVLTPRLYYADDWVTQPKDYCLFGIKYINKYHGYYLQRGVDVATSDTEVIESVYHAEFVEQDEVTRVVTAGYNKVLVTNRIRRGTAKSPGDVVLLLTFDDNNNCSVESAQGDAYNVTGSGRMLENGDTWGGKEQDVIYLDYTYDDVVNSESHSVKDTLVIRDRDVKFEAFEVLLK